MNSLPSGNASRVTVTRSFQLPSPARVRTAVFPVLPADGSPMIGPRLPASNATRKSSAAPLVRGETSSTTGPVYASRSRLTGGQIVSERVLSHAPAESSNGL